MAKPTLVTPEDERRMTVIEHLEELRRVLIISLIAWAVATVVGFLISGFILDIVLGPVKHVLGPGKPLYFTAPIDKFFLYFKVGIFTGFILASPVILWQVWTFVAPGLHRNERRFAVGFVASAVALFAIGIGFAFFAMPIALRFLVSFGTSDIQYLAIASSYINFALLLIVIFGITFELPLAMTMLGIAGIVSAKFLSRNRFKFWLGIFAGANMVTPGVDPFTPTLLTAPLIILFEISILVIRALRR
ncbi:MAG TPA: twin-arginine translocase subunit TatC [Candidatus Dormibacteraeota bacterium]|jgi:sec-independent protein translocase protein TatC